MTESAGAGALAAGHPEPAMREVAEAFRMTLPLGLSVVDEIVTWADTIIDATPSPPCALIELALCSRRDLNEITELLGQVPGTAERVVVLRLVFGLMRHSLARDGQCAPQIAETLYTLALEDDLPDSDAESEMRHFSDALYLAAEGIHGDPLEVVRELNAFLDRYAQPMSFLGETH